MTQRVWPPAFPLDPDARVLPAPLAAALSSAGAVAPVILLVAGPRALENDWASQIAVALAEAWSREGPRLVLADLSVGAPALDRLVGEPNDEGLADVFLYGASLRRVIRGSATRGFGFIPAGTAPADSDAVLTDDGWRQVVAHFFRDGAILLCYAPWSATGLSSLATRLGAVIALAQPEDLESLESALPSEAAVLAVVGPAQPQAPVAPPEEPTTLDVPAAPAMASPDPWLAPAPTGEEDLRWMPPAERETLAEPAPEAEPAAAAPESAETTTIPVEPIAEPEERARTKIPESPREALVEALWARRAGGPNRQGAAPPVDPVPGREATEHEKLTEPFVLLRGREPEEHHFGGWSIAGLVAGILVAVLAVLYWQVHIGNIVLPAAVQRWIPGSQPAAPAATAPATGALAPRGAVPQPPVLADSLPYSVAIEAHPRYASAMERAAALTKQEPDVGFFVTPTLVRGSIYYTVMAGPVADSTLAAALMQRLLDAGVKTGGSLWDIRATRLAFILGDFASTDDANRRAAEVAQKNIPTYVVEVPTPGGPPRWRLYAGAFEGAADANVLRPLLRGAGVPDSLVPRIGRSPQ